MYVELADVIVIPGPDSSEHVELTRWGCAAALDTKRQQHEQRNGSGTDGGGDGDDNRESRGTSDSDIDGNGNVNGNDSGHGDGGLGDGGDNGDGNGDGNGNDGGHGDGGGNADGEGDGAGDGGREGAFNAPGDTEIFEWCKTVLASMARATVETTDANHARGALQVYAGVPLTIAHRSPGQIPPPP